MEGTYPAYSLVIPAAAMAGTGFLALDHLPVAWPGLAVLSAAVCLAGWMVFLMIWPHTGYFKALARTDAILGDLVQHLREDDPVGATYAAERLETLSVIEKRTMEEIVDGIRKWENGLDVDTFHLENVVCAELRKIGVEAHAEDSLWKVSGPNTDYTGRFRRAWAEFRVASGQGDDVSMTRTDIPDVASCDKA